MEKYKINTGGGYQRKKYLYHCAKNHDGLNKEKVIKRVEIFLKRKEKRIIKIKE